MSNLTIICNLLPYVPRETSVPVPKEAIREMNTCVLELIEFLGQIQDNLNCDDSLLQHRAAVTINNILIVTSHVIDGQANEILKLENENV